MNSITRNSGEQELDLADVAPENLRVRSMPELLDASVALYRDNFLHFLGVAAVTQLPLGLLNVVIAAAFFSGQLPSYTGTFATADTLDIDEVIAAVVVQLGLVVLGVVVGTIGLGALLYSLQARLGNRAPGVLAAYRGALPRVPALLGARLAFILALIAALLPAGLLFLVAGLAIATAEGAGAAGGALGIFGGMALLALGGLAALWLWVWWRFHSQAAALEAQSPLRALGRSRELVRGRWWRTLGFVLLLNLLVGALSLSPTALAQLPLAFFVSSFQEPPFWASLLLNSVTVLTEILLLPLEVIAATLLYYDYRVRHEALDLELELASLQPGVAS